ncbi:peptidyl-prolyl cis-trans isomerase [Rhizorhapis suberifaciens]|uniref:Parvulin-like PPIase n=1 Tax=Rhizorhapis suberifaciens TaxID=13656 RepID=A0A840HXH3_9SPHN|nr:peptidyl-prolyl cis-trans isomerase [Rhizorhapis suberifaciens]MBB4642270.1 peptidyl-prolyl cis-trans isomerase D [Rhizorhapis suberifaciens]
MISFIRRLIHSKIGLGVAFLLVALAAVAFAAGDITGSGNGLGTFTGNSGTVAKVGGDAVTAADLQGRTQMVFDRNRQQQPQLEMTSFLAQGGMENVLDQLIQGLAVTEFAHDEGMSASKRLIDGEISSIGAFRDASGNFSEQLYHELLRRQNITDAALRQDITRDVFSRQVLAPVAMGSRISRDMTMPYASLLLESREGRIAVIPSKLFISEEQPNPQELAAYYSRNADRFTVPEQRQLRYLLIDKTRFEKAATPTEGEIAAYYNENKANYAAREERTLAQLIVPTQAAAETIAAKVKSGSSLAEAAKGAGLAVATLNNVSLQQYGGKSSPAVAKGVFATSRGQLAPIAKSPLGWHVVEVTGITTSPARSLPAVRAEIVTALRQQKSAEAMTDFLSKAEDQIAEGTTFEEFARDAALPIKATPLILRNGAAVQQENYKAPPELQPMLDPAFSMELDDEPQMVTVAPDQLYALVDVTDIKAAAPPPLDKVRNVVVQQFKLERAASRAQTAADQLVAKMSKGADFAKALVETGLKVPPPQPLGGKRADIARGGQQVPPPLALLFSMVEGSVKRLEAPNSQGYFVLKLDKIERGDAGRQPSLVNAVRQEMSRVAGNEYAEQFTRAVQQHVGIKKNEAAIAEVKRQLRSGSTGQ